MKVVFLNGSARKGNVFTAIKSIALGMEDCEKEIIDTSKLKLEFCKGCGACGCYKGCVSKDDTNEIVDKLVSADLIVFATPIYWWGITSQLKLLIDKCYSKGVLLKNKKIGLIVSAGADVNNPEYDLIKKQFDYMAGYLNWDFKFFYKYYGKNIDSLANDESEKNKLIEFGKSLL